MSLPPHAISVLDPDETDTRGVDFTAALPADDSLASCAVSIVSGTCQLAAALAGTWSTTAAAAVASNVATVAIKGATAGSLVLLFRGTSTAGRILDETRTLQVQSR